MFLTKKHLELIEKYESKSMEFAFVFGLEPNDEEESLVARTHYFDMIEFLHNEGIEVDSQDLKYDE